MSSKRTKTNKTVNEILPNEVPVEQVSPEQQGEPGQEIEITPEQQQIDIGQLTGYFENMRNNYFEIKRCIWLVGHIDWFTAIRLIQRLNCYDTEAKEPITIYLSSPGGDCDAGFAILDVMDELKRKGIVINTIACGSCSSMASVILANGTIGHRYAFPSSRIMIHQAGIVAEGFAGKLKDVSILQKELQNWTDSMNKVFKKQTGKTSDELRELTAFDNFMSASEAKKLGLIDKVKTKLI